MGIIAAKVCGCNVQIVISIRRESETKRPCLSKSHSGSSNPEEDSDKAPGPPKRDKSKAIHRVLRFTLRGYISWVHFFISVLKSLQSRVSNKRLTHYLTIQICRCLENPRF